MAPRFRVCGNRGASDGLDCHQTKSSGLGGGVPDLGPGCRGPCFGGCGSSARRSDTGAVGYASQLLSRLGLESNLAQCADGVCAEGTRDRNAAQSLTDQANPAAGSREQRKAVAPRTLDSARIAAAAAAARAGSAGKAPSAWWASPTSGREGLPVIPCRLCGSAESRWGSPGGEPDRRLRLPRLIRVRLQPGEGIDKCSLNRDPEVEVSASGGASAPHQSERLRHGHSLADGDGRRAGDHVCVGALHLLSIHQVVDDDMSAVSAAVCCHRAHDAGGRWRRLRCRLRVKGRFRYERRSRSHTALIEARIRWRWARSWGTATESSQRDCWCKETLQQEKSVVLTWPWEEAVTSPNTYHGRGSPRWKSQLTLRLRRIAGLLDRLDRPLLRKGPGRRPRRAPRWTR